MTRRFNWLILAVLLFIGAPYYWLLLDNRPGTTPAKPVTIGQLRSLASSVPGAAPSDVEMELVAWRRLPGNLFAAGSGMKRRLIGVMAWQLPVPGGKPVLIDTGLTQQDSMEMGMEKWRADRQARVDRAMDEAGLILLTHEHPDHQGALVAKGGRALMETAALNALQRRPAPEAAKLHWRGSATPMPRIVGNLPAAIAPGIVVIPAPSHTLGSQMIFVRLGDGREYLFTGDIATLAQSWKETRARSRLVGEYFTTENRAEVFAWLKTIRALKAAAPNLIILTGHDFEAVFDTSAPTGVHNGFNLSQIKASSQ